ncbi:hypothetical protein COT87_00335 [Candidatus Collierbacteria bacterium CG10_big_fil_rev_8_21_14_0_10_44_9]|uniref:Uncharacterized protein n=1 Tax=Candidatus Collierbacteria bacterium CG10_big_fil_rev_8_21_14_0_10_44_9 TaxID=1974535 RepID=A0A2H0VJL4_9BACT|nr:MAG: hypothetical protein COT87_00335 [Candidatus Collierbacteria bacterium CG10_big_fil_rev_8_21_14_0_10_44_9]
MTIGPKKYDCNLEIAGLANVVVKVAGPVHVTGTFRMTGSATLQADPSLGTNGTMFIVDRWTYLSQNSKVMPTTTNDPANTGYLLFIQPAPYMYGSNNGSFCNCTFDIYSQDARAIFYTKYGSIRLSAYAHVTALTAGTINFSPGSSIIFDSGLPLETFTSGGLAWQFTKGSYHAVTPAEDKNLLAVYDETLQVPACATAGGISCDSGTLLNGRDNVTPEMVEQHASNTLPIAGFRCPDDIGGSSYRIDKLRVETVDGQPFAPGKSVIIKVDFYLVDTAQEAYIDFFYSKKTNNVQGADMQNKGSVGYAPYDGDIGGFTATSAPFTLNSGGDAKHFVRVNMHVTGGHPNPHSYCSQRDGGPATSGFDERDDLVFNVGS